MGRFWARSRKIESRTYRFPFGFDQSVQLIKDSAFLGRGPMESLANYFESLADNQSYLALECRARCARLLEDLPSVKDLLAIQLKCPENADLQELSNQLENSFVGEWPEARRDLDGSSDRKAMQSIIVTLGDLGQNPGLSQVQKYLLEKAYVHACGTLCECYYLDRAIPALAITEASEFIRLVPKPRTGFRQTMFLGQWMAASKVIPAEDILSWVRGFHFSAVSPSPLLRQ